MFSGLNAKTQRLVLQNSTTPSSSESSPVFLHFFILFFTLDRVSVHFGMFGDDDGSYGKTLESWDSLSCTQDVGWRVSLCKGSATSGMNQSRVPSVVSQIYKEVCCENSEFPNPSTKHRYPVVHNATRKPTSPCRRKEGRIPQAQYVTDTFP